MLQLLTKMKLHRHWHVHWCQAVVLSNAHMMSARKLQLAKVVVGATVVVDDANTLGVPSVPRVAVLFAGHMEEASAARHQTAVVVAKQSVFVSITLIWN